MTIRSLVRHLALPAGLLAAALGAAVNVSAPGPQVGQPAPGFTMKTTDGKTVSLADFRGKTLVLNVWATWCPPCREETPALVSAAKKLKDDANVAFLGVDTTEEAPIVRAFEAAKGVPYPQAIDRNHAFAKAYGIHYFPTTIVIDPDGIVRDRHVDEVNTAQMLAFVDAAERGETAKITTKIQARIDSTLAPGKFRFGGDRATIRKQVKTALAAIDKADAIANDGDAMKGEITDFERTRDEENALRERAIAALAPVAKTSAERAELARMRGDAASARDRWNEAADQYTRALALEPKNKDALSGLAMAQASLNHDQAYVGTVDRLASIDPSASNLIALANAYTKLKDWPPALDAARRGVVAAEKAAGAKPNAKTLRIVAWAHLYNGRIAAKAGKTELARQQFAAVTHWAMKLPRKSTGYAMYLEEAQEATVALDLGAKSTTTLSLSPWTGPDLPGSVASTVKYRLVVAGPAGKTVALRASGLPKTWVASFCSDRVCAPFRTTLAIPPSGVKVVEFQVIPGDASANAHPTVRIDGNDGTKRTITTTVIAAR